MYKVSGKCELLRDKNGQPYLAADVQFDQYSPYARFMLLNNLQEYINNKLKRDNGFYHVTLINAAQWGALRKNGLNEEILHELEGKDISFTSHGIGMAEKDGHKAYFVILENDDISQLRAKYNLQPHDFHMTLAFNEKDVHGVSKGKETCVYSNEEVMRLCSLEHVEIKDNLIPSKLKP